MEAPGQKLAVLAEALYLANLMIAPGLAFAVLLFVYWRYALEAPPLAANHLAQTVIASVVGGLLIVGVVAAIILMGGLHSGATWVVVVLYFTLVHSSLIIAGMVGLVRAMNGRPCRYPLIHRLLS